MIVKSISFKSPSFGKLLKYITNDKKTLLDNESRSFAITHNLKGKSIAQWERQFKENETYRLRKRKDSVILTHEILSWHKGDAEYMTIEKMQAIAREYIKMRNPNGMYIAVPHFDKDHYHIHICASGLGYRTGRSLRMSKAEFAKLKRDIQKFQIEKFPELSHSIVDHGRKSRNSKKEKAVISEKEFQLKRRTQRETKKDTLESLLENCFKTATSKDDFYLKLQENGLETYIRGGRIYGVIHNEKKHRFNTLGYEQDMIDCLDTGLIRGGELSELRTKRKERTFKRNR